MQLDPIEQIAMNYRDPHPDQYVVLIQLLHEPSLALKAHQIVPIAMTLSVKVLQFVTRKTVSSTNCVSDTFVNISSSLTFSQAIRTYRARAEIIGISGQRWLESETGSKILE